MDANLAAEELDKLRGVLESVKRTVQVVDATEAVWLLSVLSAGIFTSVGVVFHGPGVPSWLLDGSMVEAVNRCLTAQGSLDLLGCSVRPEDLALSALYTLYPDHPICASADITGRNGNWTLELLVQDGGRVSRDRTRSLANLYFTSAAYDLDVQLRLTGQAAMTPQEVAAARAAMRAALAARAAAAAAAAKAAADAATALQWQQMLGTLQWQQMLASMAAMLAAADP